MHFKHELLFSETHQYPKARTETCLACFFQCQDVKTCGFFRLRWLALHKYEITFLIWQIIFVYFFENRKNSLKSTQPPRSLEQYLSGHHWKVIYLINSFFVKLLVCHDGYQSTRLLMRNLTTWFFEKILRLNSSRSKLSRFLTVTGQYENKCMWFFMFGQGHWTTQVTS